MGYRIVDFRAGYILRDRVSSASLPPGVLGHWLFVEPQQGVPDLTELKVLQPSAVEVIFQDGASIGGLLRPTTEADLDVPVESDPTKANWTLRVAGADVANTLTLLRDILFVCHYKTGTGQLCAKLPERSTANNPAVSRPIIVTLFFIFSPCSHWF